MRLKIIDIREDYKGDLWFLCENYYMPSRDGDDGHEEGTRPWVLKECPACAAEHDARSEHVA